MSEPSLIDHFEPLADRYDAILSDVWGVVHNGVTATASACDALIRVRQRGGHVVLITNAPRPGATVVDFIDRIGVPREAYDTIVSSGDVTRAEMKRRPGRNVFHMGPERDLPIFEGLGMNFVALEQADYAVCTGLRDDETETPETYRPELDAMRARGMFMLCGNPDLVVERGHRLLYCAGAIADLYASLGGDVLYAGKPHAPIYDLALGEVARVSGRTPDRSRVIAIGDSIRTDVAGAQRAGLDCLFVTAGIHAEELGDRHAPDLPTVRKVLSEAGVSPKAVMTSLAW